mgnify:CR=1 FL=1
MVYAGAEVHPEHFHSNLLIQVHGLATTVGRSCYKAPTPEAQRNMLKRVLLVCRKVALTVERQTLKDKNCPPRWRSEVFWGSSE